MNLLHLFRPKIYSFSTKECSDVFLELVPYRLGWFDTRWKTGTPAPWLIKDGFNVPTSVGSINEAKHLAINVCKKPVKLDDLVITFRPKNI